MQGYRPAASEISEDQWAGHSWDLCAGTGGIWKLGFEVRTWDLEEKNATWGLVSQGAWEGLMPQRTLES